MRLIAISTVLRCLALLAVAGMASACSTAPPPRPVADPAVFLHDDAFPGSDAHVVESRDAVFLLDAAARAQLDSEIGRTSARHERRDALIREIIQRSAESLSYASDANTTASETFHRQSANCLSMSIMAYAMASHLGFEADFQAVDIPEYWERRENHNLVARHINVIFRSPRVPGRLTFDSTVEIDFFAPGSSRRFRSHPISESAVLAMFYNNKGVDALMAGDHDLAYAYLRAALQADPSLGMVLGNLAFLYDASGHAGWAEQNYREAMARNPDDTVSAEGLALVLKKTGREKEAEEIFARLSQQRENNPYFHYVQGEQAYDAGNWQQAIRHFNRAVRLRPDIDRPYFGLAKAWLKLGDRKRAESFLRRAEHYADREETRKRYRNKISMLSGI